MMKNLSIPDAISPSIHSSNRYLVLCDVIPSNREESRQISLEVEESVQHCIQEYLLSHPDTSLNEIILTHALEKAHQEVLQKAAGTMVSIVIIAPLGEEFLMAGVGDYRVYGITLEKIELAFCDPYNIGTDTPFSIETRRELIHNALGLNNTIDAHCRRIAKNRYQTLLALSYGAYMQIDEQGWQGLTLPANALERRLATLLQQDHHHGHRTAAWLIATHEMSSLQSEPQSIAESLTTEPSPSSTDVSKPIENFFARKSKQHLTLTLSIVTCLVVVGIGFRVLHLSTPFLSSTTPQTQEMNLQPIEEEYSAPALVAQDSNVAIDSLLSLREQNRVQQEKLDSFQQLEANYETLRAAYALQNDALAAEHEQLESLQQVSAKEKEELQQTTIALQNELTELKKSYEEKLQSQQNQTSAFQNLKNSYDALQEQHRSLETTHAELIHRQKDEAEHQASLKASLEVSMAHKSEMEETLNHKISALSQTLQEREDEFAALKEKTSQEVNQLQSLLQLRDQEFAVLTAQHREQQTHFTEKDEQLQRLQAQCEELSAAHQHLLEEKIAFETSLKELSTRFQEKELQLADTEKQIAELQLAQSQAQQLAMQERQLRSEREKELQHLVTSVQEQKKLLSDIELSRHALALELEQIKQLHTKRNAIQTHSSLSNNHSAKTPPTKSTLASNKTSLYHTVAQGETLSTLSQRYYGTSKKWQKIYEANQGVIPDKNRIRIGTKLKIPSEE